MFFTDHVHPLLRVRLSLSCWGTLRSDARTDTVCYVLICFPWKYTFGHLKYISSHSFWPRRGNTSFCRKLNCLDRHIPLFNYSISYHWKHATQKKICIFWKKKLICFSNFYFSEIRKISMWRSAPGHCKWNKIITFVISAKL